MREWLDRLLPDGSLRRRMAWNAMWSTLGSGLSQALALATTVLAARMLGAEPYGQLGMVVATVGMFATVAMVGLGVTSTKYVAEHRARDPARAGRVVGASALLAAGSGAVVSLALAAGADWIATATLSSPGLGPSLRWSALFLLATTLNGAQSGTLMGFEAFRSVAAGNLVRGAVTLPAVALGIWVAGLGGAILGYTAGSVAGTVALELLVRQECRRHGVPISYRIDAQGLRMLWTFSLPALVAGISFTPATWWANAVLVSHSGFVENGVFSAARQWQNVVLFLSTSVANLGLPMLASAVPDRDHRKYVRTLGANFALTTGLALLVAVPVAAGGGLIMRLYGPEFVGRGAVLAWTAAGAMLMALNVAVGQAIWSLDAARAGMLFALLRGAALVVAAYALAGYGADGLAGAYVVMGLVQTAAQAPFMWWLLGRQKRRWVGGVQ